ncbi:MAG TPA: thermonuclease family protein [Defluviitoga sp.]|nr:thermonuclease family protein [Defluviitoga sp.]HOP24670.1 thermonuclease family protein [Defluviitoga sp.]HPZ28827.1 thermonuclease family protein [Defluviitoga sp.]HQD63215.1 thermonuclease family protein [Defluviitoga sp.]
MKKFITFFTLIIFTFTLFSQSLFDITSIKSNIERLKAYEEIVEQLNEIESEENDLKKLDLYDKFFEEKLLKIPISLEKGVVTRIIDGDTVEIEIDGKIYKTRFVGIDTPESTTKIEPFGLEASLFTTKELLGKTVYLEKDVSETDRYGRLLRYIWLEPPNEINDLEIRTKMFNAILLLNGFAKISTFPPDVKYEEYFLTYSKEAQENNLGLWALIEESVSLLNDSTTLTDSSSPNPKLYVDSEGRGLIKGNINSSGEKIYHIPGGIYYEQTIPEVWFKTEEEAQAAGFRKSKR